MENWEWQGQWMSAPQSIPSDDLGFGQLAAQEVYQSTGSPTRSHSESSK